MVIKGKYNNAKVFTDLIEDSSIEQLKTICDMEIFKDNQIRIMPDVHSGKGCTIGTTMTIKDKIIPNLVGVDIGCGMDVVQIKEKSIDFKMLDDLIHKEIPSGRNCRNNIHTYADEIDLTNLRCKEHIDINRALYSIGSLGGGNHFIEVDKDDEGNIYIVIHSGSRHLGKEVAEYYQKLAYETLIKENKEKVDKIIETYKREGKQSLISNAIVKAKKEIKNITLDMAYLVGKNFDNYIHDMKIVQKFAVLNRKAMIDVIIKGMNLNVVDAFTCIHNYIDTDSMIMRKGAVSAKAGEKILIPINMRDGSLICLGKGNEDWNCSAPHGAGRVLSRMKAKETLTMKEFKKEMEGIYSTSINASTLDESPMAYKSIDDIVKYISPTVDIVKHIKPIYNFKASE